MPACLARVLLRALDEGARVVVVYGAVGCYRLRAWLAAYTGAPLTKP